MRTENKEVKKKQEQKDKKPLGMNIIALCVLFLILLMAVSAAVASIFDVSLINLGNKNADGEMIYTIGSDKVNDMYEYSSGVVLLTDSTVEYLEADGKRIASNSHLYANPVMKVNKKTVLLYDKGGNTFRLERNSSVYNTYTVNSSISTATIGKKDNYAYVLSDDAGFQSHMYVYSYQGKKQFEWGSASDYCLAVALSDNGKSAAVSMISVVNGEYLSKVIWFDFKLNEPVFSMEFHDSTVYELTFSDNKTLVALTDNGIFAITKEGVSEKIAEYLPSELHHSFCCKSGMNVLAVSRLGNPRDSVVSVFDKKFKKLFELEFDAQMNVCSSKDFFAVILDDTIKIYNKDCEITAEIILNEKCYNGVFSGRTLFVETVSGIYSFDTYTSFNVQESSSENVSSAASESTGALAIQNKNTVIRRKG